MRLHETFLNRLNSYLLSFLNSHCVHYKWYLPSRLYHEISQHGGKDLLASEVKELFFGNKLTDTNIKEEQIADLLKVFDRNGDQIITKEEFVTGLTEYINQTKHALDRQYLPKESMNKMYQV